MVTAHPAITVPLSRQSEHVVGWLWTLPGIWPAEGTVCLPLLGLLGASGIPAKTYRNCSVHVIALRPVPDQRSLCPRLWLLSGHNLSLSFS